MFRYQLLIYALCSVLSFSACHTTGPAGLFKKMTPHEAYGSSLKKAGLDKTALGIQWFSEAGRSLTQSLQIKIPYRETGYFAADRIRATVLQFTATRGEKLNFSLSKNPAAGFKVFIDVWKFDGGESTLIASADTSGKALELEVKSTGIYLIRLQPE